MGAAPGRWELSSLDALTQRQLLKSRGSFFAEHVLVAVTPVEVVAVALGPASLLRVRRRVWSRSELQVEHAGVPGRRVPGDRSGAVPVSWA